MQSDERALLAHHFAAMAAEGPAMAFGFLDDFGDRLRSVVCRHLRDLYRPDVAADDDEVHGLVIEVALELADRAGSWDPDAGALPWTWAERAIRSLIARAIGHARVDGADLERIVDERGGVAGPDDPRTDPATDAGRGAAFDELGELAGRHPEIGLLRAAIGEVVTNVRQGEIYAEYRLQLRLGDPSPSHTVAARFAMSSDGVRQVHSRVHRRLSALVTDHPRYGALREMEWFA